MTAAEAIAFEHVTWLRSHGATIAEAFAAIKHPMPSDAGWDDVVAGYAAAWTALKWSEAA